MREEAILQKLADGQLGDPRQTGIAWRTARPTRRTLLRRSGRLDEALAACERCPGGA